MLLFFLFFFLLLKLLLLLFCIQFVNGWYYLLPESIGRRKHLQVSEYYLKKAEQQTEDENPMASPVTYKTHAVSRQYSRYSAQ